MIKTYERWFEKYWVFVLALFTVIHSPLVTDVVLTKNYAIVRGLIFSSLPFSSCFTRFLRKSI